MKGKSITLRYSKKPPTAKQLNECRVYTNSNDRKNQAVSQISAPTSKAQAGHGITGFNKKRESLGSNSNTVSN